MKSRRNQDKMQTKSRLCFRRSFAYSSSCASVENVRFDSIELKKKKIKAGLVFFTLVNLLDILDFV